MKKRVLMSEWSPIHRIPSAVIGLVLLMAAATGTGCAWYGNPGEPECTCDDPPAPVCVDGSTLGTFGPGECADQVCQYPRDDTTCPDGACVDGECTTCQPDCTGLACGPDPVCGSSCGQCLGCEGEPDPSLCDPAGFCYQVCCPECGDRECGPDGCGGICDTCPDGCTCGPDGSCSCDCTAPGHPPDCSLVTNFQCGIEPVCEGGTIHVNWHEHVMCDGEELIVDYSCSYECPLGCEEGWIEDWPASGQDLVADHCYSCDGILMDNQGPPGIYPPMFSEDPEGATRFAVAWERFMAYHGLAASDYEAVPHTITFTPEVNRTGSGWAFLSDVPVTEDSVQAVANSVFTTWGDVFGTAGITREPGRTTCSGSWCRAVQQQTYCGLTLVSDSPDHDGTLRVRVDTMTGGLLDAFSAAVPMVPVPINPSISQEDARTTLLGMMLEYWCADGLHTVQVGDDSTFTFEADPVVFVFPRPGAGILEYRLAHQVRVEPLSFLSWTILVDGFDGQVLKVVPDFICD